MSLSLEPVLASQDVRRIHEHSLDLLERVGIVYNTPRALEVLEARGCPVDYDRNWASLPRELVEWALTQAPRVVRLCARDPARDVVLDGRRSHYTTDSQAARVLDLESGEVRPSTAADLERAFLTADALDIVDVATVMVAATDVPAPVRTIHHFATGFRQTSKHVRTGVLHPAEVPFIVDLATAAVGGDFQPILSAVYCPVSPLMHDGDNAEAAMELVKLGVPLLLHPMSLAGATAPASPIGSALQYNVEVLSALVLFQVVAPGAPMIYAAGASQMDLHSGHIRDSATASAMRLALVDLARFYNLPVNLVGLETASSRLDAQYGYDTNTCLLASLAGVDEIYSVGLLDCAQILSFDKEGRRGAPAGGGDRAGGHRRALPEPAGDTGLHQAGVRAGVAAGREGHDGAGAG